MISNSYVWRLVFFRLGVTNSYVWELVILTFGGKFSYVWGLVSSRLEVSSSLV